MTALDQRCPHCGIRLGWKKLAFLSPTRPSLCPKCGQFVSNTWRGLLLGLLTFVLTLVSLLVLVGLFTKRDQAFFTLPLLPVALIIAFAAFAMWAEPRAIEYKRKFCDTCHREDVGYFKPGDTICADCTERLERERVDAIQAERRARRG